MRINDSLRQILACPIDKAALLYFPDDEILYNPRLRRSYAIDSGVPILLAHQAEPASSDRHRELIGRAIRGGAEATLGRAAADLAGERSADPIERDH